MSRIFKDITGKEFGRLKVLERVVAPEGLSKKYVYWLCSCSCNENKRVIVTTGNLCRKVGGTKSCGCLKIEASITNNKNRKNTHTKQNTYDLSGEYGVGFTIGGDKFLFDTEDYKKIESYYWWKSAQGYIKSRRNNKDILLHKYITDTDKTQIVDHRDRNKLDCRKQNLRFANKSQNNSNADLRRDNTSGVIGVSYIKRNCKWKAEIKKDNKAYYLGYYSNMDNAIRARLKAEQAYFGEFAPQQHLYKKYGIEVIE